MISNNQCALHVFIFSVMVDDDDDDDDDDDGFCLKDREAAYACGQAA